MTYDDFKDYAESQTIHGSPDGDSTIHVLYPETVGGTEVHVDEVRAAFTWREACPHVIDCCGCTFASTVLFAEEVLGRQSGRQFVVIVRLCHNV